MNKIKLIPMLPTILMLIIGLNIVHASQTERVVSPRAQAYVDQLRALNDSARVQAIINLATQKFEQSGCQGEVELEPDEQEDCTYYQDILYLLEEPETTEPV